ncbi:uncharacterized protein LOC100838061 isoform X2 [Brachypodium distachyon]|uniref:At1g61320/AtMIF1 LRR domain-containing protein n=1 Tax=Brachypodium distachyon TaxID=15368 RepID=A0A2K2DV87_BRADI|nr:uncharacterized protein LOC100838061 isoform X2 [Brachypodium distachyon]PNT78197.1 hypothetical protein BRADI_1g75165v3 [Brachypodium distachyon]|eukprot:XP_024313845.1 uncharacterized protein LOC100838061 isoform X2 [Brachypodium distachyon]
MEIQKPSLCSWQQPKRPGRRRRPHTNTNGTNGLPCSNQATDISEGSCSMIPHIELPKDVLGHIYSLLTIRDAARAACVSRQFLLFWRCFPNLVFNRETLAARRQRSGYVFSKARQVLENHSVIGAKMLKLNFSTCNSSMSDIDTNLMDGWLQAFVKPGIIVDLAVLLPDCYAAISEYNFPYSLLLNDDSRSSSAASIQSLHLGSCGFHPINDDTRMLACSWSLSKVRLSKVSITGDELCLFLSSCFALEELVLSNCDMIKSIKLPRVLHKLKIVHVRECSVLRVIESEALRLTTFTYEGWPLSRFTLGDSLETRKLDMHATRMQDMIQYAGSNFPSIAPNLETLMLSTDHEKLKAPAMAEKFKHLKHLVICLGEWGGFCTGYDFLSLACFLDACVALETFVLRIADGFKWYKKYLIVGEPDESSSQSKQEIPEFRHGGLGNLRRATITGFCSAKSLVELTCHILEKASTSLECFILDASPGYDRTCSSSFKCLPMSVEALRDAEKALANVRKYVEPKVPVGIEFKVLEPCSRCHAMDAKAMQEAELEAPRKFWQRQEDGRIALVCPAEVLIYMPLLSAS